jgi:membrane-bound lytic murein transglycosylase D
MDYPAVYNGKPISDASEIKSDSINAAEMENNNDLVEVEEAEEIEPKTTRSITHKVKKGETLQALANKYNTDTKALMKINQLKNGKLKAGQTLKIKEEITKNKELKNASSKSIGHKIASKSQHQKVSSHKKTIKSKRKSSGHISARSHIRLK